MSMHNFFLFFFNDTPTTEIYTLSLHDALPISTCRSGIGSGGRRRSRSAPIARRSASSQDRKSTRLNSSHVSISYAVFCLKKKNMNISQLNFHTYENIRYDRFTPSYGTSMRIFD